MKEISEKELRKIRHILFEVMDKKIIEYSETLDVKTIQEQSLITWKHKMNSNIEELRREERQ